MRYFVATSALGLIVACAGGKSDAAIAPPTEPIHAMAALDASAPAPPLASDASSTSAEISPGTWRVETKTKGKPESTVETWPNFEHVWEKSEPFALVGQQRLCLPKGRYVFDFSSSPSLHSDIEVDGQTVITQRAYPSEISKPLAFDGTCKTVRAFLSTPHP